MKVILSPAKIQNFKALKQPRESSIPMFSREADLLAAIMRDYTPQELQEIQKTNPQLSAKTWAWFQKFNSVENFRKQAGYAFNGLVYNALSMSTMDQMTVMYAQQHLRILSGLYGMLRPLDLIQPYRLDVADRIETPDGSLYNHWMQRVTSSLLEDEQVLINLASDEYFRMLNLDMLPVSTRIITPIFMQLKDDRYKVIVTAAKRARGLMSRYILENRIEQPEGIMAFDLEGYFFFPDMSTQSEWVFLRD